MPRALSVGEESGEESGDSSDKAYMEPESLPPHFLRTSGAGRAVDGVGGLDVSVLNLHGEDELPMAIPSAQFPLSLSRSQSGMMHSSWKISRSFALRGTSSWCSCLSPEKIYRRVSRPRGVPANPSSDGDGLADTEDEADKGGGESDKNDPQGDSVTVNGVEDGDGTCKSIPDSLAHCVAWRVLAKCLPNCCTGARVTVW